MIPPKRLIILLTFEIVFVTEPTDAGIIPPQFRKPQQVPNMPSAANHTTLETNNAAPEKKQPHQWSSNPVEEWAKEQVIFTVAIRNKD